MLRTSKECSDLGDISWDSQIANGAQIGVLGFHSMFRYSVIVEGDLLYAEFDFGGFDLDVGLRTTAQKGLMEVIHTASSSSVFALAAMSSQ